MSEWKRSPIIVAQAWSISSVLKPRSIKDDWCRKSSKNLGEGLANV